jgi:hypothetical protein
MGNCTSNFNSNTLNYSNEFADKSYTISSYSDKKSIKIFTEINIEENSNKSTENSNKSTENSIQSTENSIQSNENLNQSTFMFLKRLLFKEFDLTSNNEEYSSKKFLTLFKVKKMFTSYNILDYEKNIIIGIWDNPNKLSKLGNQGIWIESDNKIYELKFGMICFNIVVLNFESNIRLILKKNKIGEIFLELNGNNIEYNKRLEPDIIKNLHKINNNSIDLDLIFGLF